MWPRLANQMPWLRVGASLYAKGAMVSTFLDFQKATDRYEEGVNAALDSIDAWDDDEQHTAGQLIADLIGLLMKVNERIWPSP